MLFFRSWLARKGFLGPLLSLLKQNDPKIRAAVVAALSQLNNPKTIDPLCQALTDEVDGIRESAAKALGNIQAPEAVGPLKKALEDGEQKIRRAAARSLLSYGAPEALWGQARLAGDGVEAERFAAGKALEDAGDNAFDPLQAALISSVWQVRAGAAENLGRAKITRGAEPLCTTMQDEDADVRRAAATALGHLCVPFTIEHLQTTLNMPNEDLAVRRAAAASLTGFGGRDSLLGHVWMLAVGDRKQKQAAEIALQEAGQEAFEPLVDSLKDGYWSIRRAAAQAMAQIQDIQAVQPLCDALADKDWQVRFAAVEALGDLGFPDAFEPLQGRLEDEEWKVRAAAASALGRLRYKDGGLATGFTNGQGPSSEALGDAAGQGSTEKKSLVDPIIAALRDKNENVRAAAAAALGELGDLSAVLPLCVALKDLSDTVRAAAAGALGKLKDHRAFEPLIGALNDWYSTVCRAAAESLVLLGPPAAIWGHTWLLGGGEEEQRNLARKIVLHSKKEAFDPLVATLKDWHSEVRVAGAKTLGELKDARAVSPLCSEVVRSPLDLKVIDAVFRALVAIQSPGTGTQLAESLDGAMFQSEDMPMVKKLLAYTRQLVKAKWMTKEDQEKIVTAHKKILNR